MGEPEKIAIPEGAKAIAAAVMYKFGSPEQKKEAQEWVTEQLHPGTYNTFRLELGPLSHELRGDIFEAVLKTHGMRFCIFWEKDSWKEGEPQVLCIKNGVTGYAAASSTLASLIHAYAVGFRDARK